ncbi:unnamed protein product [Calicophoron daubneyi]|uniref:Uncharacterized protein n=1 Tax=Calicophoron daubneyi TaxID=300641 RepID=A0AAV2U2J3_CALDB
MEDIRKALEVELDRLRLLVQRYKLERIPPVPLPRTHNLNHIYNDKEYPQYYPYFDWGGAPYGKRNEKSYSLPYSCENRALREAIQTSKYKLSPFDTKSNEIQLPFSGRPPYFYPQRAYITNPMISQNPFSSEKSIGTEQNSLVNFEPKGLDIIERRRFKEVFLRIHEFYRNHYPLDSEMVIEIRSLRAAYEYTGGKNPSLIAALENTLDEALKVEAERRLGILNVDTDEPKKFGWRWDYPARFYERDYRWEPAIRAYEIERANRESELIRAELERLRAAQDERARRQIGEQNIRE